MLDGSTVYLGSDDHCEIVDVSAAGSPALLATTPGDWGAEQIALAGAVLLAADLDHGLRALDVSSPAVPVAQGSFVWPNVVSASAVDASLAAAGSSMLDDTLLVYMLGEGKLWVVDMTDPSVPEVLATVDAARGAFDEAELRVSGGRAYAIWQESWGGYPSALQVFDVADPSTPVLLGQMELAEGTNATGIHVVGTAAYVTTESEGDGWLHVYDTSNPASIVALGGFDTPGSAEDVAVSGAAAYVADGANGMQVVDITNAAAMSALGQVAPPNGATANTIDLSGTMAYVGSYSSAGWWVQQIDVSSPASPALAQTSEMKEGQVRDLEVAGDALYAAVEGQSIYTVELGGLATVTITHTACTYHIVIYYWWGRLHIIVDLSSYGSSTYTKTDTEEPTATTEASRTNTSVPSATNTDPYWYPSITNTPTKTGTPTNSATATVTRTPTLTPSASWAKRASPTEAAPGEGRDLHGVAELDGPIQPAGLRQHGRLDSRLSRVRGRLGDGQLWDGGGGRTPSGSCGTARSPAGPRRSSPSRPG